MYSNYGRMLSKFETDTKSKLDQLNKNKLQSKGATKLDKKKKRSKPNFLKRMDYNCENKIFSRLSEIYTMREDKNCSYIAYMKTVFKVLGLVLVIPVFVGFSGGYFFVAVDCSNNVHYASLFFSILSILMLLYVIMKMIKYDILHNRKKK
ncbi:hypothetical protein PVNG_04894 [Plasmodium vivax North Korean]|uniref:Pv-fam-d protein n=1 Tax=Plasmodium vivax North Korean TaxID=1035514 RepID=A0A0J9U133_PLAVI|nr:hypothetical protein PVNG_04894 [Plasmodium vivax North Korean]